MYILVVSQCYYPEAFRINDICAEWVKRGHKVTVITSIPNYPEGRFYDGYGWFKKRVEVVEGVEIHHIPMISRGHTKLRLILNYISFVVSGFIWSRTTRIKPDRVFNFETSPIFQALPAVWFAKRRKIPCDIYVQDLWPENVQFALGLNNKAVLGAIDKIVDYVYRNCTSIFATSPSFKKHLEKRQSVYTSKTKVNKVKYLPQYAEDFYEPYLREEDKAFANALGANNTQAYAKKQKIVKRPADIPCDNNLKLVFTGNVGQAQGLEILPKAASILKKDKGILVDFVIIGDGRYRSRLEKAIEEFGVSESFFLLGRKAARDIPTYLTYCDVAFLSFADNEIFKMTIPAKLQSYMACAKPIIAAAEGETANIIREAECGSCVAMGDEKGLADAIESFANMPKQDKDRFGGNARAYVEKHFSKNVLMDELEEYLAIKE